jgi:hypothetical protein
MAATQVLGMMPRVTCLIGSTKFAKVFAEKNLELTLAGHIVLSIGAVKSDYELGFDLDFEVKHKLDVLHMWKIVLADEVYCINVDGYIGDSTARELGFAEALGRPVTFHEPIPHGSTYTVNHDAPQELTEVLPTIKAIHGTNSWVRTEPRAVCYIDGCSESVLLKDGRPVITPEGPDDALGSAGHSWVSDERGGVTRWFCSPRHLIVFVKARRRGQENGYDHGRPGPTKFQMERARAKAGTLRDPEVQA